MMRRDAFGLTARMDAWQNLVRMATLRASAAIAQSLSPDVLRREGGLWHGVTEERVRAAVALVDACFFGGAFEAVVLGRTSPAAVGLTITLDRTRRYGSNADVGPNTQPHRWRVIAGQNALFILDLGLLDILDALLPPDAPLSDEDRRRLPPCTAGGHLWLPWRWANRRGGTSVYLGERRLAGRHEILLWGVAVAMADRWWQTIGGVVVSQNSRFNRATRQPELDVACRMLYGWKRTAALRVYGATTTAVDGDGTVDVAHAYRFGLLRGAHGHHHQQPTAASSSSSSSSGSSSSAEDLLDEDVLRLPDAQKRQRQEAVWLAHAPQGGGGPARPFGPPPHPVSPRGQCRGLQPVPHAVRRGCRALRVRVRRPRTAPAARTRGGGGGGGGGGCLVVFLGPPPAGPSFTARLSGQGVCNARPPLEKPVGGTPGMT